MKLPRFVPRVKLPGRKPLLGSLRSQLLARTLLLLAILLAAVGIFQYLFMERFLFENRAETIQRQIRAVPGDAWLRLSEGARRDRGFSPFFGVPSATVVFRDENGNVAVLASDPGRRQAPVLSNEVYASVFEHPGPDRHPIYRVVKGEDGREQLVVVQAVRSFGGTRGLIQISTDTAPLKAEVYRQLVLYGGISLFALLLGWLMFVPAIRRTLAPLSNVGETMERIDAGSLAERLPSGQGQAEIDKLASSFNRMLERLEQSFRSERDAREQMRRFVADASHELRTPLTSIHGFLEVLLRGAAANPKQLELSLNSMYDESRRLSKLVQDLLLLTKLDRAPSLQAAPMALDGIVREMEPQLRLLAQEREVVLDLKPMPPAPLDRDKIKQVILNLFHNAVQHTDPQRGRIAVAAETRGGRAVLTVTDNGDGIPADKLPKIFDRFYRLDESRARIHGGTGLGLSISRSIAELHGGTIEAESAVGEGSVFRLLLPLA